MLAGIAAAIVIASAGGCERWRERREARRLERERALELEDKTFLDATQPGVEVAIVPVRDASPTVAAVLGPYETRPVPADPALLYRWRLAGLRVVALPMDDADAIIEGFESAGTGDDRQWAEMPNWAPIVAGPWDDSESVGTGERAARVGAGRSRLLARAWFEPWIGDGGIETTMRLELVPQRERPREQRALSPVDAPGRPGGEAAAGPVFAELALTLRARGDDAYVIVGAPAGEDWSMTEEPETGAAPGPAVPKVRTVGESMLIDMGGVLETEGSVRVRQPARVLVVIRPRVPGGGAP